MRGRQVTVTVDDLNVTLEQRRAKGTAYDNCRDCLVSTAVRRAFGTPFVSCGLSTLTAGHVIYTVPREAEDLVLLYDNQAFDALRALLPVTLSLEVLE
ncbi:MAG: hypothetical protein Q8O42_09750 [Acidobacteriota bacterium]|nr:hypothetical protein [Acidobacteriota bacterium]